MEENDTSTKAFNVDAVRAEGAAVHAAQLIVIDGCDVGQNVELNRPRTDIGRRETNHLVLASPTVSREHAYVACEDERYFVVDVGSRNGVYVNGQRIPAARAWYLSHGDSLALGEQLLLFHCPERLLDARGSFEISIDRNRVSKEVDEFFAHCIAPAAEREHRPDETDKTP